MKTKNYKIKFFFSLGGVLALSISYMINLLTLEHEWSWGFLAVFALQGTWKHYPTTEIGWLIAGFFQNIVSFIVAIYIMVSTLFYGTEWTFVLTFAISLGALFLIRRKAYGYFLLGWIPIAMVISYLGLGFNKYAGDVSINLQIDTLLFACAIYEFLMETVLSRLSRSKQS